nr:reverse transcriptase domain-containing protein [Tanacetum cinerariifolium]
MWAIGVVRDLGFSCDLGHHSRLFKIIPPRIRTRSAGRPAAESLRGRTGVRVGRGGRGRRPREGNDERVDDLNGQGNDQGLGANGGVEGVNENVEGVNKGVGGAPDFLTIIVQQIQNLLPAMLAQVGNQGNVGNQNGNVVNENVRNVLVNGNQIRTLSREVAVIMSWNDFMFMMIQEFCPSHEIQKLESELWNHAMVGAGHAAYTDRFHELARLVPHLISGALTDEAVRIGSIKKVEKRGNVGEPSKDKNGRDDNKRIKTRNAFVTTVNPVRSENTGTWPKCTTCNSFHAPGGPYRTYFNCNRPGYLAKDCRSVHMNVNLVNAKNPTVRACNECARVSAASELQRKYANYLLLLEVIENGATLPITKVVEGVMTEMPITSTEEKARIKLEVKARSTLMMGIPNEHQLKFNSIKDAKKLLKAVKKRFGRNAATKKTQKNLLKKQYENFTALSSEMLDQTFDRLQKLVYEPKVKWMSSSSSSTQNMAFVSFSNNNTSSTNEAVNTAQAVNTAHGVSTTSTQVNAAYFTNMDNLSDAVICLFFASQPNKGFLKNIRRKLTVNGNETIGFDKSKVECYNCHKRRHFSRECRTLRNQDNKHKESSRKSVHVETSASTALVSCDGLGGYDWSDPAKEGPNYALMAFSSSSSNLKVSDDSTCSKSYLETVKLLKCQNDQQLKDLKKSELMVLVENCKAKSSEKEPKKVRKNDDVPIIKEWVSDNEEEDVS